MVNLIRQHYMSGQIIKSSKWRHYISIKCLFCVWNILSAQHWILLKTFHKSKFCDKLMRYRVSCIFSFTNDSNAKSSFCTVLSNWFHFSWSQTVTACICVMLISLCQEIPEIIITNDVTFNGHLEAWLLL